MKMRRRVYRGLAQTLRLGSLRDPTTGQAMTPSFVAGDATITQDDGIGVDNCDNIPTVEAGTTDVLWGLSAAEATPPVANGPDRVMHLYDQGTKAWIDLDVVLEFEGLYGFVPAAAVGATTVTLPAAAQTGVHPVGLVAVVVASDEPLDIGAQLVITSWVAATQVATGADGWTRTPTGTLATLQVVLYAASSVGQALDSTETQAAVAAALVAYPAAKPTSRQGQNPAGT